MYTIQQITSAPQQIQTVILNDGSAVSLSFVYMQMQYSWFISNLTYGNFTMNWTRVFNSLNMLHQFRNQIPFGISCLTVNNREPTQLQDFSSGASTIYFLDSKETAQYAALLSAQTAT